MAYVQTTISAMYVYTNPWPPDLVYIFFPSTRLHCTVNYTAIWQMLYALHRSFAITAAFKVLHHQNRYLHELYSLTEIHKCGRITLTQSNSTLCSSLPYLHYLDIRMYICPLYGGRNRTFNSTVMLGLCLGPSALICTISSSFRCITF